VSVYFDCPYLGERVELTDERRGHIERHHPDLKSFNADYLAGTLSRPDRIRRSRRDDRARLFSRCYDDLQGKHVVIVVISEPTGRHWIVTSYVARKLEEGEVEWQKS
jgi:hypothetical protein